MPRALFEKTGNAIYISHLDLMRLFQRAFKRADLPLTHSKGFNPRPSVSIALPLSLGVESVCELLDFTLEETTCSNEEMVTRLNEALVSGIRVLAIYDDMDKLKNLAYLDCQITLEYDHGIPANAQEQIQSLFSKDEVLVEKKSKNGISEQNIAPMIQSLTLVPEGNQELVMNVNICCQNPSLNPSQIHVAICKYLPDLTPDFVRYRRMEVYNTNKTVFR